MTSGVGSCVSSPGHPATWYCLTVTVDCCHWRHNNYFLLLNDRYPRQAKHDTLLLSLRLRMAEKKQVPVTALLHGVYIRWG